MKQFYYGCIIIIVIMLLHSTTAYYTSFTSDMAYNTIAYTSYPIEITPDKRTNKLFFKCIINYIERILIPFILLKVQLL